jgi:hypothetical protein
MGQNPEPQKRFLISRIIAQVQLCPDAERQAALVAIESESISGEAPTWLRSSIIARLRNNTHLELRVRLHAETEMGQLIPADGSFSISMPRQRSLEHPQQLRGLTLEENINIMLGRGARRYRPSKFAWEKLIVALRRVNIEITEDRLIALPFEIELDADVKSELFPGQ